jgi:capsular polysaccharide biosynthesis protein
MSQETLGLRGFMLITRRHLAAVSAAAVLGLVAGGVFAALTPPVPTSEATVVIPDTHDAATQVVIAGSNPVLAGALRSIHPATSLASLRGRVQVRSVTNRVILISAQGKTAVQAESTANAVADSFVAYVSSAHSAAGQVKPRLLDSAMDATGTPLSHRLLVAGGLGAVLGALLGAIAVIRRSRSDRRFRMT